MSTTRGPESHLNTYSENPATLQAPLGSRMLVVQACLCLLIPLIGLAEHGLLL